MAALKIVNLWAHDEESLVLTSSLKDLGHDVLELQVQEHSEPEFIFNRIKDFKPDFCLIRNFYVFDRNADVGLPLKEMLEKEEIPIAVWYVDSPYVSGSLDLHLAWHYDLRPKNMIFFVVDREHKKFFKEKSLPVHHLPIGFDEKLLTQEIQNRPRIPISYCGSSPAFKAPPKPEIKAIIEQAVNACLKTSISRLKQLESARLFLKDIEGMLMSMRPAVTNLFTTRFNDSRAYQRARNTIFEIAKKEFPAEISIPLTLHHVAFDFLYSNCELIEYMHHLLPQGLQVYGNNKWRDFLPEYSNFTSRLSDQQLWSTFKHSEISFCLTKHQFISVVHERPLQVIACGGFPLTDNRDELWNFFDKDEIAVFRSIEEAKDKAQYYLKKPEERQSMTQKARQKLEERHTNRHRMKRLIDTMQTELSLS